MMPTANEPGRSRHRSPNYPALSLSEAIDRVRLLYDADKRAGAPVEAALRHLGFSGKNGRALVVLSALKKFGLIEDTNGRITPTQLAVTLLAYPEGDPRRSEALRSAALSPYIYRSLVERYGESGLPSDPTLHAELEVDFSFNPSAIPDFIKGFRETLSTAGIVVGGSDKGDEVETGALRHNAEQTTERLPWAAQNVNHGTSEPANAQPLLFSEARTSQLHFRISQNAEATVQFQGEITQQAVNKLIALLEITKDVFPAAHGPENSTGKSAIGDE